MSGKGNKTKEGVWEGEESKKVDEGGGVTEGATVMRVRL